MTLHLIRRPGMALALLFVGVSATLSEPAAAQERFFAAIEAGDSAAVQRMLKEGAARPDARNAEGESALHRAAERGRLDVARALIGSGANVKDRTKTGETPLHLAGLNDMPVLAGLLIDAGATVDARNAAGETPLFWAALTGHAAMVQALLDRGADPNARDGNGSLPLHAAADSGVVETVRVLLAVTRNAAQRNREGMSARDVARLRGHAAVVKFLGGAKAPAVQPPARPKTPASSS